ncbi:MAG: FHA domain-containing protein [Pseudomonadota bacterium]
MDESGKLASMLICITAQLRNNSSVQTGVYEFQFDQNEVLIGRAESVDVRLPDPSVSSVHLRLIRNEGQLFLMDDGSTNGTMLDGKHLVPGDKVPISVGAQFWVGNFVLTMNSPSKRLLTVPESTASFARQMVHEFLGMLEGGGTKQPCFKVERGPQEGQIFEIPATGGPFSVGRGEDCTFRLTDADVSRHHFDVCREGDRIVVNDAGSQNGVFLNDLVVIGPRNLRHGDKIRLGQTVFAFVDPTEDYLMQLEKGGDEDKAACLIARSDEEKEKPHSSNKVQKGAVATSQNLFSSGDRLAFLVGVLMVLAAILLIFYLAK